MKQNSKLAEWCGVKGLSHVLGWWVKSESYEVESGFQAPFTLVTRQVNKKSRSGDSEWQTLPQSITQSCPYIFHYQFDQVSTDNPATFLVNITGQDASRQVGADDCSRHRTGIAG